MKNYFVFAFAVLLSLSSVSCSKKNTENDNSPAKKFAPIVIQTDPAGASISILGKDIGTTPKKTKPVPPGPYVVKVAKDGYQPAWAKVVVTNGKTALVDVSLKPVTASVVVNSNPPGAMVSMDGKEIGTTPVTIPSLKLGKYNAVVGKPGFSKRKISWELINDRPIMIQADLTGNVGEVNFSSVPEGAMLYVDNRLCGTTPLLEKMEQGQHRIKLEKAGYKTIEKIITVSVGNKTESRIVMQPLPASLEIRTTPQDADISLNGVNLGKAPLLRQNIAAETYKLRAVCKGFDPVERSINLSPGETFRDTIVLGSNTGSIEIIVNPPGVSVFLDGKFIGKTQPDPTQPEKSKVFVMSNLAPGRHELKVYHRLAKPKQSMTSHVTVKKNKTSRGAVLTFWIPNARIELKSGRSFMARIENSTDTSSVVRYEEMPMILTEVKRSEIKSIKMIKSED